MCLVSFDIDWIKKKKRNINLQKCHLRGHFYNEQYEGANKEKNYILFGLTYSYDEAILRGGSPLNFWNLSTAVTFEFLRWHILNYTFLER